MDPFKLGRILSFAISCLSCFASQNTIDRSRSNSSFHYPCIPVMGVAVLVDPLGFLPRLGRSLDFCIDNFVLVISKPYVNSSDHANLFQNSITSNIIRKLHIVQSNYYITGVSEGWNLILKSHLSSPWYLICGYDVEFLPGQLEDFSLRFWNQSGSLTTNIFHKKEVFCNFAHTKWQNLPGGKGFGLFALSNEVIKNCGYFDENIFPAFWEDRDWKKRLQRWPGAKIRTYRHIRPWHGSYNINTSKIKYISGTLYLPSAWKLVNNVAGKFNREYVVRKWGCDLSLSVTRHDLLNCSNLTPFGNPKYNLSYWIKDDVRINKLRHLFIQNIIKN